MTTITNTQKQAFNEMQAMFMDKLGKTAEEATDLILSLMEGMLEASKNI